MINEAKNKQIKPKETREEELQDFHFSGEGRYHPLLVQARSREEAEKIWLEKRTKVEPTQESKPEIKN